jgi:hypothetical protein
MPPGRSSDLMNLVATITVPQLGHSLLENWLALSPRLERAVLLIFFSATLSPPSLTTSMNARRENTGSQCLSQPELTARVRLAPHGRDASNPSGRWVPDIFVHLELKADLQLVL